MSLPHAELGSDTALESTVEFTSNTREWRPHTNIVSPVLYNDKFQPLGTGDKDCEDEGGPLRWRDENGVVDWP